MTTLHKNLLAQRQLLLTQKTAFANTVKNTAIGTLSEQWNVIAELQLENINKFLNNK